MGNKAEHLADHRFQPGQSGNPNGRPKGARSLSTVLREFLELEVEIADPVTGKAEKKSLKQVIALRHIKNALEGNQRAIDTIYDRTEGRPKMADEPDDDDYVKSGVLAIPQSGRMTQEEWIREFGEVDIADGITTTNAKGVARA